MLPCEYSAKILHSASPNSAPAVLPVRQTLPRNTDALTTKLCTHQGYAKDKTPKMGPSQTLFQNFTQLMFASKELQTQSSRCGDCQPNIFCLLNSARLAQQQPAAHLFSVVIDKKKCNSGRLCKNMAREAIQQAYIYTRRCWLESLTPKAWMQPRGATSYSGLECEPKRRMRVWALVSLTTPGERPHQHDDTKN